MPRPALPRLLVLAAFASLSSGAMGDAPVQPGGWEMKAIVTARETPSSPPKTLTESTTRVCLTKDFLAKDPYLTPGIDRDKMEKKGAKCSISDPKRAVGSASWKMNCVMADGNSVDMQINNTVAQRKMKSEVQQIVRKGGQDLEMKIIINSTHIGECTKDMMTL
ncbi:DUF3617 domain-containing protein [Zoogloea sp.]|uniref:DUF3617 domain-containing protein n=1 Tax=Zoogloea sp. TaxID=49181 RepID=UPI0035B0DF7F